MALLKNAVEIKKYLVVDGSFKYDSILPYLPQASVEVKRLLGQAQYEELEDYYQSGSTSIEELDDLLPYVQGPLVFFAFLKAFDIFNISIGNNGFAVTQNANLAPASRERTESLRKTMSNNAWDLMEEMLVFLEENKDDYPLWEESDAYAMQYRFLISSARKFDELYRINRSRLTFLEWRPTMADVEQLQIIPITGSEILEELKTQAQAGNMTDANQLIYTMLQKALAYLTAVEKGEENMKTKGNYYLNAVKKYMDQHIEDFPTYADSSAYISTQTSYSRYENTSDSHVAVF